MADLERIYVVPLRSAYDSPRTRRSRKAVKILRSFISRHMKAEEVDVAISQGVNSIIWKRGIQKPPRKIKVRAVKSGEKVVVSLLDEKVDAKKVEAPKPKKEEAKPAEKPKEEKKPEAAEKPEPKKAEPAPEKEEKKEPEKPAEKPKEEAKPEGTAPGKKE